MQSYRLDQYRLATARLSVLYSLFFTNHYAAMT